MRRAGLRISAIVSGMAAGPDLLGHRYGKRNNIEVLEFPADWDKHGKAAGPIRNREMAKAATHLLAFWDGKSTGTKDMIDVARARGLIVRIVYVYQDQ